MINTIEIYVKIVRNLKKKGIKKVSCDRLEVELAKHGFVKPAVMRRHIELLEKLGFIRMLDGETYTLFSRKRYDFRRNEKVIFDKTEAGLLDLRNDKEDE